MYRTFGKRILDLLLVIPAIIVLSPVYFFTALLIWLEDRGPAIFKQKRVGIGGEEFTVFKFRSMPVNTGDVPSRDASTLRITKVGKVIRRLSIDELPQLFNILFGTMSLVGYRPGLRKQTELFDLREAANVHSMKPGLTGLAQIRGFDGMSDEEKAALDAEYVGKVSLGTDIKIILKTFLYLLKPPPAY